MMKKWIGGIFVLIVFALMGPRVEVNTAVPPVNLPDDIDQWLQNTESQIPLLRRGADKKIVWLDPVKKNKTPFSVVYLHGFSANRQEIVPVMDEVASKLSANLFYTRLTGHGQYAEAMKHVTVNDWLRDVEEALAIGNRIGDRVILAGVSTGAALATWAALQHAQDHDIAALVLISPNFWPAAPGAGIILWPWGPVINRLVSGPYRVWDPINEAQAQNWTYAQHTNISQTVMGFVGLLKAQDFTKIQQPVLLIHSDFDQVVSVDTILKRYEQIGSAYKKRMTINNSGDRWHHVLAGNILSPQTNQITIDMILEFLQPLRQTENSTQ
ncbi:MAG: alpha/beta fold hydrolase [SAR324 cluster bacterium]|nr:alpha/beta fold hydrolase [SAR324 cluster bacterium]